MSDNNNNNDNNNDNNNKHQSSTNRKSHQEFSLSSLQTIPGIFSAFNSIYTNFIAPSTSDNNNSTAMHPRYVYTNETACGTCHFGVDVEMNDELKAMRKTSNKRDQQQHKNNKSSSSSSSK